MTPWRSWELHWGSLGGVRPGKKRESLSKDIIETGLSGAEGEGLKKRPSLRQWLVETAEGVQEAAGTISRGFETSAGQVCTHFVQKGRHAFAESYSDNSLGLVGSLDRQAQAVRAGDFERVRSDGT